MNQDNTRRFDLTDYKTVKNLLKHFKIWTKKRLGQHFLTDKKTLEKIIEVSDLKENEYVTEIGPGHGVLTLELLKKKVNLDVVEIDEEIIPVLNFTTAAYREKLEIHHKHVLGYEQKHFPFKLIANIPYHLSSPILRKFYVESENPPEIAVLLIQKEVAEKICNRERKSILSLFVEVFADAEIVKTVDAKSFFPPPKVKSAVLKITALKEPRISIDRSKFFSMVKRGFTAPRKMLKNVLAGAFQKNSSQMEEIFDELKISATARAENLEIRDWENLAERLIG